MKKFILLISFTLLSVSTMASDYSDRGRYYDGPDMELASASTVGYGILWAFGCFLVGYLLNKMNKEGSLLGGLFFFAGIICLVPLLAWMQAIFQSIIVLGFAMLVVGSILYFLYNLITGKSK